MKSTTIIRKWLYTAYKSHGSDLASAETNTFIAKDPEDAQKKVLKIIEPHLGISFEGQKWEQIGFDYTIRQSPSIPDQKRWTINLYEKTKVKQSFEQLVQMERNFQDKKWGIQNHAPYVFYGILGEEHGEVAKAINTDDIIGTLNELVQLAAVAQAFGEMLLRNHQDD